MRSPHLNIVSSIAVAVLAGACASKPKELPPSPFAGTHWQVVLELPLQGEQPNMRFGDGRVEGFSGCSRFTGRYLQDAVGARAIAFGRLDIDRRLCPQGAQAAEQRIFEVLPAVSSYTINGDVMMMSGSAGTLRLRAVDVHGIPVAAAAAGAGAPLKGTRWMGVVDSSIDPRSTPWLEFVAADRVSGYNGCNMFSGPWQMEGSEVRLGPLMSTKRGCLGPEGDLEKRVAKALAGSVRREGGKLVFTAPSGEKFEFTEAK